MRQKNPLCKVRNVVSVNKCKLCGEQDLKYQYIGKTSKSIFERDALYKPGNSHIIDHLTDKHLDAKDSRNYLRIEVIEQHKSATVREVSNLYKSTIARSPYSTVRMSTEALFYLQSLLKGCRSQGKATPQR